MFYIIELDFSKKWESSSRTSLILMLLHYTMVMKFSPLAMKLLSGMQVTGKCPYLYKPTIIYVKTAVLILMMISLQPPMAKRIIPLATNLLSGMQLTGPSLLEK